MKLSYFTFLLGSAGAISQVGAAPLGLIIATIVNGKEVAEIVQPGGSNRVLPPALSPAPAHTIEDAHHIIHVTVPKRPIAGKKTACGFRAKAAAKAQEVSNLLRGAIGLPTISATSIESVPPTFDAVQHMNWLAGPGPVVAQKLQAVAHNRHGHHPHPHHRHGKGKAHAHRMHHRGRGHFLRRLTHALMCLGKWEGRAVAFVLGCGIGVPLRMAWVFAVLIVRGVRGSRSIELEETSQEADLPLPQYRDEKILIEKA